MILQSMSNCSYSIHLNSARVPTLAVSLFLMKGLLIQESTFFSLLPVIQVLLASFNKANGELLVHLTSP